MNKLKVFLKMIIGCIASITIVSTACYLITDHVTSKDILPIIAFLIMSGCTGYQIGSMLHK